ncbi:MAG TPA: CRISPR-associated helicase Cas3' [Ktedonobacteraceae bacterium]|nr:CRISPR-associated helicase Cas3' [Ktedonobacteraceae bacterium]
MFTPYPYQKRLLKAMMQGRNVILLIPTGGGKTRGAILPFWQNKAGKYGLLPEKALYVVPMRVLATQFRTTCDELYQELNPNLFREAETAYQHIKRGLISIQTGESPEDPAFESMITACTIDQALSGALGIPYGLDGRKANLNVGAISSSYLILDEPHLYPVSEDGRSYKGAFTTCLELLRLLHGLTRFVFMSATLSTELAQRLSTMLDAELIELDDDELQELNKGRSRTFACSPEPLSAERILQLHDRCSLVVCNTVQRAQETYLQLWRAIEQQGRAIELRLLHSRFTDEDRKQQAEELSQLLGKTQWQNGLYQGQQDSIVVATQVVEVGLDISVQTLHSELAPANSLVQRAGRCARFEKQQGRVIIYPLAPDEEDKPASTLPYAAALCQDTWDALQQLDGAVVGFREEQRLIDQVHTTGDMDLLDRYEAHRDNLQSEITTMLRTGECGHAADLIRDVNQVHIVIHDEPDEELKIRPWRWQSFGLHPGSLMGKHWERLQERQAERDLDWVCKRAEMDKVEQQQQDAEDDHRLPTTYNWPPVTAQSQIPGALLIALPHQLATYDKQLGLVFLDGRIKLPDAWKERLEAQHYQSELLQRRSGNNDEMETRLQRYEQHIGGLADAYHYLIYHELAYAMQRLEHLMGLDEGTIDTAIQLAIATHDLGKLDKQWQRWARAWQRLQHEKKWAATPYPELDQAAFLAKTDYDYQSTEQRKWQEELSRKSIKRPKHACESVMAAAKLIHASLGVTGPQSPNLPVARAVYRAIAHHHSPTAHEYGKTEITEGAKVAIKKAFEIVRRGSSWSYDLDRLFLKFDKGDLFPTNADRPRFTHPEVGGSREQLLETWLAFLIVRALRLADQRADSYAL